VLLGLGAIAVLAAGNLRWIRQGGATFAVPTYLLILAMYPVNAAGLIHAASSESVDPGKGHPIGDCALSATGNCVDGAARG
jgi:hypothetical protein